MLVGEIRKAIQNLSDNAPVYFRILSGPDEMSITTYFKTGIDNLEVLFEVSTDEVEEKD